MSQSQMSSDKPISSKEEDLLNRSGFAQNVADVIKEWKQQRSLVIGLYGQWGSGKTSLKNLIVEFLKVDNKKAPYIVEFNPWQYSNNEALASIFFHEIGVALDRNIADSFESEMNKNISARWKKVSSIASIASTGAKVIGAVTPGVSLVGDALEKIASVADSGSKAAGAKAESKLSLFELKEQLDKDFKQLDKPILVIIDDVDRLSSDEIVLLFQLIKANGDFHNLIYLVMCQRSFVETALGKLAPGAGREFLEKIVQIPFDIPVASGQILKKELFGKLAQLGVGFERLEENKALNKLYSDSLKTYFVTMRDICRFINTLSFHVVLLRSGRGLQVNVIDLIVLEVLRVFEQGIYERMPTIRDSLLLVSRFVDERETHPMFQSDIAYLLDGVAKDSLLEVKKILSYLFPNINFEAGEDGFGRVVGRDLMKKGIEDRRVYHQQYFDRYFQLVIPSGDIRIDRFNELLSLNQSPQIVALLDKIKQEMIFSSILLDLQQSIVNKRISFDPSLIAGILSFWETKFNEVLISFVGDNSELVQLMFCAVEDNKGVRYHKDSFDKFMDKHKLGVTLELLEEILDFVFGCGFSNEEFLEVLWRTEAVLLVYMIIKRCHRSCIVDPESSLAKAFCEKFDESVEKGSLVVTPFLSACFRWRLGLIPRREGRQQFISKLLGRQFRVMDIIVLAYGYGTVNRLQLELLVHLNMLVERDELVKSYKIIERYVVSPHKEAWRDFKEKADRYTDFTGFDLVGLGGGW